MTSTSVLFEQSELALTAYAENLSPEMTIDDYRLALEDINDGMSRRQAEIFASTYAVVDQYTDSVSGVSATLFRNKISGDLHLAVRGTELLPNDLLAGVLLTAGVSASLNPQFAALATQIDNWLRDPARLQGHTFTVSGHPLGGYLAAAVKEQYAEATEAYVFNAPGSSGLLGTIAGLVSDLFGAQTLGTDGVWNIKATEGLTFAAGLGRRVSAAVPV